MAQHAFVVHHQSDHDAANAVSLLLVQRGATDEVALLVQRHGPAKAGFPGRDRFIHVLAVQVHAGFQAQRVACAEARRLHARRQQAVPERDHGVLRQQDFEAVFAGVAGPDGEATESVELEGHALERAESRGQGIGYDPADGGTVQPITPANAGRLVRIGTSRQSRASNASVILIAVLLDGRESDMGARNLSVVTAASSAITNTVTETAFSTTFSIPANRLRVGSVLSLRARASVSSGNSTDTLTLRARLTNAAGAVLGAGLAFDVTNGGGDVGDINLQMVVRTLGAAGTMMSAGTIGLLTAVQATGSAGAVTIDTTAAITIVITAQWSVASASNSVTMDGGSLQIVG